MNSPSDLRGPAGRRRALERLRAAILGIDEIAFEVRGQHARSAGGRANRAARTAASIVRKVSGAQATDVGQNAVTP